ncbi:MAG: ROK family protein [Microbacterium enclense]
MIDRATERGIYAGVDVGGTKTAAVLVDEEGEVIGRSQSPTRLGETGVVVSVVEAIADARQAARILSPLRAAAVGVPGAVDPVRGYVGRAVNIALDGFALADAATAALGVPVRVDNDVTLAARGLARSVEQTSSLALVNLGTGFGVGVVIDGAALRGHRGAAGEIGHLPFDPKGSRCGCGLIGCLELSASGGALARAAGARTVPQLFVDAAAGDASSAAAVEAFCAALALGLRIVVQAYDVETVAMGGGVFASREAFMPRVCAIIEDQAASSSFLRDLRIVERLRIVDDTSSFAAEGAARWARDSA